MELREEEKDQEKNTGRARRTAGESDSESDEDQLSHGGTTYSTSDEESTPSESACHRPALRVIRPSKFLFKRALGYGTY